jgi:hypothetical protein
LNWNKLLQLICQPLYSILPPEIILHSVSIGPDELWCGELQYSLINSLYSKLDSLCPPVISGYGPMLGYNSFPINQ